MLLPGVDPDKQRKPDPKRGPPKTKSNDDGSTPKPKKRPTKFDDPELFNSEDSDLPDGPSDHEDDDPNKDDRKKGGDTKEPSEEPDEDRGPIRTPDVREHSPGRKRKGPKEKFPTANPLGQPDKDPKKPIGKGPTKKRRKPKDDKKGKDPKKKHPSRRRGTPKDGEGSDPNDPEVPSQSDEELPHEEGRTPRDRTKRKPKRGDDPDNSEDPDDVDIEDVSDPDDDQDGPSDG